MKVKNIANLITIIRILGTMAFMFIKPFSKLFFIIYFICGISDVLDGIVARKMNLVSKKGQILDSIADFFMFIVLLFVFIINFRVPLLIIYWVVAITIIRLISLFFGFMRYKELAFLHTYANKLTGVALFCFPFMYVGLGMYTSAILVCSIGSISALEELIINIISKKLSRDIKSIFSL